MKSCLKSTQRSYASILVLFKIAQKVTRYLGNVCKKYFYPISFKNNPIRSHCNYLTTLLLRHSWTTKLHKKVAERTNKRRIVTIELFPKLKKIKLNPKEREREREREREKERRHRGNNAGSTGLVVVGGGSCCNGRGFESQHHILDGYYFTFIFCKNCNVCLKIQK